MSKNSENSSFLPDEGASTEESLRIPEKSARDEALGIVQRMLAPEVWTHVQELLDSGEASFQPGSLDGEWELYVHGVLSMTVLRKL